MAKEKAGQTILDGPRTVKQCSCGATLFQGPFEVGELVVSNNTTFLEVKEELYLCRGCNKVQTMAEMSERTVELV